MFYCIRVAVVVVSLHRDRTVTKTMSHITLVV